MISEIKSVIYGAVLAVMAILVGYIYHQHNAEQKLQKTIRKLNIDVQNRDILYDVCKENSEISTFEKGQSTTIQKEKGQNDTPTDTSIGEHTISFK